ncbi:hypothetical protein [Dokdonia donghaensis]|uniref:Lipoprotein n=1 Tax=Dokdonia donghaensis DSW-1 TaxID=1300343 RepID=A0A0A2GWP2_9FLAO|nr:hypothetical protein [Dokdonia donghaensis]ANH59347.1 hypothetical protein I597_0415 [Dokdonia donghaensis DSW-1]KGO06746.1 hypothetical protein NV36_07730 [Dokdonia donghaensis DSW-1]
MKKKLFITGIILVTGLMLASCGQKATTEEKAKEETTMSFDTTGYTSGTIVQSKAEGDCEWTIKLKDGRFLDPMAIDKDFMKDGATVWIKFLPQRRMQRCDKASPVAISEIKLRE